MPVQIALDPLVPGLTDTRVSLQPLLEALAALGVRQVSASYLVLKPDTREALLRALEPHVGFYTGVLGFALARRDQHSAALERFTNPYDIHNA